MSEPVRAVIEWAATKHRLDPILVAAVILQESGGRQFAFRHERKFARNYGIMIRSKADLGGFWPERTSDPKWEFYEREMRSSSFGLMQILLQTARELGFLGVDPWDELVEIGTNLDFGCRKLSSCVKKVATKGSSNVVDDALYCFNGGGNPHYPGEVLERIKDGTAEKFFKEGHVRS
jgi:soluble lytic murein transglycosylase-like protein